MNNMKQLGYYAKNNIFQFEWDKDVFHIIVYGCKIKANFEDYEILEIGYFISEN